jgi:hypothetical protein
VLDGFVATQLAPVVISATEGGRAPTSEGGFMSTLVPVLLLSLLLLPMAADASEPPDDLERRRVTLERMEELAGFFVVIWKAGMAKMYASGYAPEIVMDTTDDPETYEWTACPEISVERRAA